MEVKGRAELGSVKTVGFVKMARDSSRLKSLRVLSPHTPTHTRGSNTSMASGHIGDTLDKQNAPPTLTALMRIVSPGSESLNLTHRFENNQ